MDLKRRPEVLPEVRQLLGRTFDRGGDPIRLALRRAESHWAQHGHSFRPATFDKAEFHRLQRARGQAPGGRP